MSMEALGRHWASLIFLCISCLWKLERHSSSVFGQKGFRLFFFTLVATRTRSVDHRFSFLFLYIFLYSMYKNFKNKNNTNKNVIKMMYLSLILQSKSRNYTLLYLFAPNNPWPNCTQDSCHWQRCLSILTVCWDINKRAKTELFSENVFFFWYYTGYENFI